MSSLTTALRLDALASGALGVLLAAGSPLWTDLLGLPATFSVVTGLLLVAWAAAVARVASRPSRSGVLTVVALNAAYVAASVALVVAGWLALTTLGTVVVLAQAVAVLGLTALQLGGLRAPTLSGQAA